MPILTAVARPARPVARVMVPATSLSLARTELAVGHLKDALVADFASIDVLLFGSAWGSLGSKPDTKKLEIVTAPTSPSSASATESTPSTSTVTTSRVKSHYLTAVWHVINFNEPECRFVEPAKSA
ncbi:hypothetical protein L226DRAFT_576626 [Lentinus tigrinus ALCF2SS1-7]|uniref:uncharacterized protein n=1 Tax=Lentinus tigrinus ALCF2SS1-7 TaxID=1328758 RepID=UPI001165F33D|nr:hypothetical protein L226DRAFT_576626 [Lentinus tigrinus ALCF2SS1-7]